jgi:hypothetical protein
MKRKYGAGYCAFSCDFLAAIYLAPVIAFFCDFLAAIYCVGIVERSYELKENVNLDNLNKSLIIHVLTI